MNKTPINILLIFLISLNICVQKSVAQTLENFSGTWILDKNETSKYTRIREYFEDYTLVISINGAELKIAQSYSFNAKVSNKTILLMTDKSGETNNYTFGNSFSDLSRVQKNYNWLEEFAIKTKTYIKNGKIIRDGNYFDRSNGPSILKETYSLSKDGKDLIILTEKTIVPTTDSYDLRTIIRLEPLIRFQEIFHRK